MTINVEGGIGIDFDGAYDYDGPERYTAYCDACCLEIEPEDDSVHSFTDMVSHLRVRGWDTQCIQGWWSNFCPECAIKQRVESAMSDFTPV